MNAVTAAKRPGSRKPVFSHGHLSLDKIIRDGPADGDYIGALESARWKVVDEGIKSADDGMVSRSNDNREKEILTVKSTVRIYVWLVLLNAPILSTDDYLALIHRGASPAYSKIRNDTFRTLTTDPLFRRRVSEASLIRLLNAIAWTLQDARDEDRVSAPRKGRSTARASLASNASDSSQGRKSSSRNS
jgi:cell cycle arrest protein BUB2